MAGQINKTVSLRPGVLAKALKDTDTKKGDPTAVWGPPSPGQTWQDYADAYEQSKPVQQTAPRPAEVINQTVQLMRPQRPSSIISETKPLEKKEEEPAGIAKDVQGWIDHFMETGDLAGTLFDTGGVFDPGVYELGSREAAIKKKKEHGPLQYVPVEESEDDQYEDIYNQLIADDERTSIIAEREQPTITELADMSTKPEGFKGSPATDAFHASRVHGQDNGMYNKENYTSNTMTGDQYLRYREAGIPGRPIDEIDPDLTYSKLDERENFGFIPYMPDEGSKLKLLREDIETGPTRIMNALANARTNNTDYTIEYNGKKIESGRDFDKKIADYINKQINPLFRNEINIKDSREEAGPNAVGLKNIGYRITMQDGTSKEIRSRSMQILSQPEYIDDPDQTITVVFPDTGDVVEFEDEEDYLTNLSSLGVEPTENDSEAIAWINLPDLELEDGTRIPYNDAVNILNGAGDRDYGWMNINKPADKLDDFWRDGSINTNFNFEDLVPKMVDIAAGSAPYWISKIAWPAAISNALASSHGIDSSTLESDGTARRLKDDIDDDSYTASIIGSTIMPLTEYGLGRIGGGGTKWLMDKLMKWKGNRAGYPLLGHTLGTLGEGFEEVPANLVEDYRLNGFDQLYANPLLDEDGNEIVDDSGHVLRDEDTPFLDRWNNYWGDALEAFTGGALLGGAFGLPSLPRTLMDASAISAANHVAKKNGLGVYRPGKVSREKWDPLTPGMYVER